MVHSTVQMPVYSRNLLEFRQIYLLNGKSITNRGLVWSVNYSYFKNAANHYEVELQQSQYTLQ